MYIPGHFNVTDEKEILAFVKANAFGQLISLVKGRLYASHLPFLSSRNHPSLICHMARNNPQWEELAGQEVLVTFQGPHGYVSPSWYASPGVPTWNYQSVHIYGTPKIITQRGRLESIVNELTRVYESDFARPWKPEYRESMLDAIIGVEIEISDIQCKYKLSQNRSETDRLRVIEEQEKRGISELSKATKRVLSQL